MLKWLTFGLVIALCQGFQLSDILTSIEGNDSLLSEVTDEFAAHFENEYEKFQASGIESSDLQQLTRELAALKSEDSKLLTTPIADLSLADQFVACVTCRATARVIARTYRDEDLDDPSREEIIRSVVLDICRRLDFQNDEICSGIFEVNWAVADFIAQNSIMDSRSICGILPINFCSVKQSEFNWTLDIDQNGPIENLEKSESSQKSDNDLVLLQLTDIHYDPSYMPGALANCGEALCCRRENTLGPSQAAGYWSDYGGCDSPWHMITDALNHIKRTHTKIDMIYNTGDNVDHMIWATSKERNIEILHKVNNLLEEVFPGIPVYSSVGNHEPSPINVFGPSDAPEQINIKWMYESLNSVWQKWLPSETNKTILAGGYYTVTPINGFRIISLNNNDCYIYNWWIYYNGSNVIHQLVWLHDTLLAAERAGEHVHILAHIPSADADCWTVWSREYNRIIERFRHIISGIFTGHTHDDELNVHYTMQGNAVGISWNGGSLTTYVDKNPNYKIYRLTPKTMEVVDFDTWIFNVTEANQYGAAQSPKWFKEYTFTEEFGNDLSPAGLNKLLEKMADNPELLRKYWRLKHTSAEPRISGGCDKTCLSKVICRLSTSVFDQKIRCAELQQRLAVALEKETVVPPEDIDGKGSTAFTPVQISGLIGIFCAIKYLL